MDSREKVKKLPLKLFSILSMGVILFTGCGTTTNIEHTSIPVSETITLAEKREFSTDIVTVEIPDLEMAVPYRVIREESVVNDDPDRTAGLWTVVSDASGFEERAQTAARAVLDLFYLYRRDFTSVMLVPRESVRINYAQANFAADGRGAAGLTGSATANPGYWKIWSSDDELSEQDLAIAELWSAKQNDFPQKDELSSLSYDEQALRQYIADRLNIPYDEVRMPKPEMREYELDGVFIDRTISAAPDIIKSNPRTEVALTQLEESGSFTDSEEAFINDRIKEVPENVQNEFAAKYQAAREISKDSRWMAYSSWRPYIQSDEYQQLLGFCREEGQTVWPLLFGRFESENRYFTGGLLIDSTLPEYVYYFEINGRPDSATPDIMTYFKELLIMFD